MTLHIVFCTSCGEAWSDSGVLPLGPGEVPCTCTNPENERWVAMSSERFVWQGISEPDESRLLEASTIAYRDGYKSGLAEAARNLNGTIVLDKTTGSGLIAAERKRQKTDEGYTPEHDREHEDGALARAAAVYALSSVLPPDADGNPHWAFAEYWPAGWHPRPGSRIRMLTKAGALIAAEIDRLIAAGETK